MGKQETDESISRIVVAAAYLRDNYRDTYQRSRVVDFARVPSSR